MKIENPSLLRKFSSPGICEYCKRPSPVRHAHHLSARGMDSGKQLDVRINLIGLCPLCHQELHDGNILRIDLQAVVAVREGVNQDDIRSVMSLLNRVPKDASVELILEAMEEAKYSPGEMALARRTLRWRHPTYTPSEHQRNDQATTGEE